jgi:Ser/Thr protein kinase RdoA (MazF antagonist)
VDVNDSEVLNGGLANQGKVSRHGKVVRRPAPPHAAALHAYLGALRDAGFDGVPRPLRLRDDGYEEVSFIPGDVAVTPYPDWSLQDHALESAARLLRRMHEASAQIPLPEAVEAVDWPTDFADPKGQTADAVLCHNDFCPENVVFRDGEAVAAIDFDFAAPGRPLWDLALAAWYWIPMTPPQVAEFEGQGGLDPIRRLRLFADAYGLGKADRRALLDLYPPLLEITRHFIAARVAAADPVFTRIDAERDPLRWEKCLAWHAELRERFLTALLSDAAADAV